MAVTPIKAERIVRTMLGVLNRDTVLAKLFWLNPAGDFKGAKSDTISIRVPAYTEPNVRDLRSGATRTKSNLTETKVDVTLDTDIYKVVPITDENLTLDIDSFDEQVTTPCAAALVRGIENEAIALAESATYAFNVNMNAFSRPYNAVVRARRMLNDARVPMDGRFLAVGSAVEEEILIDDQFARADHSGSTDALREAVIGRIANMPVISIPGLSPNDAYAFHRTAFVLSTRAPMVPRGAPDGATMAWEGFAIRNVFAVDPDEMVDNFHADTWTGTNIVTDYGEVTEDSDGDPETGFFVPDATPNLDSDVPLFVRAVRLSIGSS